MQDKLNIPKLIHVGFTQRTDTYTGKLAYVIYTDEKGKKRKEVSWESWRDVSITPKDFDNVPTEGFVLNKGVGGAKASYGWNTRNEYIRIYDPRGFEFEISVANLLFILQECTSVKGKGIDGKFVYSWSGTELVLLPVGCQEYIKSTEFTSLKSLKVTKKDMIEGHMYQDKDMCELMYLGRKCTKSDNDLYKWNDDYHETITSPAVNKYHVFYDINTKRFSFEKGFTKLALKTGTECHEEYSVIDAQFQQSKHCAMFKQLKIVPTKLEGVVNYNMPAFLVLNSEGRLCMASYSYGRHMYGGRGRIEDSVDSLPPLCTPEKITDPKESKYFIIEERGTWGRPSLSKEALEEYIKTQKIYTLKYEFESGETTGVKGYVK